MKYKVGDKVRIIKGPPNKEGKVGKISILALNGAIIKLSEDWFTPVKFEHLELFREKKEK